ncbi:MAG: hypothetical protein HRT98_02640 [Mycoplasmatales bacterium]|nr:hypothetical protein [Mycoplasmatales bacterium]
MNSKWRIKGLVEKIEGNKVTIIKNYNLLKPDEHQNKVIINIENCKNKELFIKNNFLKIKGTNFNDQKYATTTKLKYILDNSYWSAPGATVAGGPHSTSDSTRRPSWGVVLNYYKNKFKK